MLGPLGCSGCLGSAGYLEARAVDDIARRVGMYEECRMLRSAEAASILDMLGGAGRRGVSGLLGS